ncbi:MAG: 2-keto-4-pentenoate hydratase [Rhodospirillaceae bacterium]
MDADTIAAEILAAAGARRQIAPFTERAGGLDLDGAYAVTAALRRLRTARGERPVGRKIGFTNRTIWAEYGVYAPIWGDMYDTTLAGLADSGGTVDVAALAEPRIEPEIAFGLACAPAPDMDEAALLGCIEWAAHGFEIVQSLFPGWRFSAPDTVAGFGLHGAYRLGPKHRVDAGWLAPLSTFRIALARDGAVAEHGRATDVLDGPLTALRHLVGLLARDPHNAPLAAGEIVTTGTLTRALPVARGERWSTAIDGLPIAGIEMRIA